MICKYEKSKVPAARHAHTLENTWDEYEIVQLEANTFKVCHALA